MRRLTPSAGRPVHGVAETASVPLTEPAGLASPLDTSGCTDGTAYRPRASGTPGRHRVPHHRWRGKLNSVTSRHTAGRVLAAAFLLLAGGCAPLSSGTAPATLSVRVLGEIPQPTPDQFVEGLATLPGNRLVESTGAEDGPSQLMILDATTGRVQRQVTVPDVFAEGVAVVDAPGTQPAIWMLTWKNQQILKFDTDLHLLGRTQLSGGDGQGWGLTYTGHELISSDGTATLTKRDPRTAQPISTLTVTNGTVPQVGLNELDWNGSWLLANQFPTGAGLDKVVNSGMLLLAISPDSGRVVATADLALLQRAEHPGGDDPNAVPNGIAALNDGTIWVTGKRWKHLVHVALAPTSAPTPPTRSIGGPGTPR